MKGVSEVIAAVLVILIAIGLVATAYTWGLPLIQKTQHRSIVERVASEFDQNNANSLPGKIFTVFSNGGEEIFTVSTDGLWEIYPYDYNGPENNSIRFTFFSKVTNIAPGTGWHSLTPGSSCPPSPGLLGIDPSSVVCVKADNFGSGYNITYSLWYRELTDSTNTIGQKINLLSVTGITISSARSLRISRGEISREQVDDKTLTLTEIKILLG